MEMVFISDTHLFHKNICRFRTQFSSPEEHDKTIFKNILEESGKNKILILGGDTFLVNNADETTKALDMMREIDNAYGNVRYILGNHCTDKPHRLNFIYKMMDKFDIVPESMIKIKDFWVTHCPMHESELRGRLNIYGHTHNQFVNDPRYIPISCEHVDYRPVRLSELRKKYV